MIHNLTHCHCFEIYYWIIDIDDLVLVKTENDILSANNKFYSTGELCGCSVDITIAVNKLSNYYVFCYN